ncbi:MAG: imidazole glycerol phosphate synthase subunit HisH [Actinomycetota bacterium]|nr:imidazole glycerol phosphate synthase subunit HisH [Actinomycetota bacterium]
MRTKIALLDYGIGNLQSVAKALNHVGADVDVVESSIDLKYYTGIVLPGVGNFGACVNALKHFGFDELVYRGVASGIPLLGVCVGLQMLFEGSSESPETKGLGLLPGKVLRFEGQERVPQMQWNTISIREGFSKSRLFTGLEDDRWMYFVHSYFAPLGDFTSSTATYGVEYSATVEVGDLYATQFHPEKSSKEGLRLLENFVSIATVAS